MLHQIIQFLLSTSPIIIYLIVAVILLLESSAVPIANSTLLLFTGALASQGHVDIFLLAFFAIVGSCTGACLAYFLGNKGGRKILFYIARMFRIKNDKVEITEHWFQKAGVWMVFFSRMIPYIRPYGCFPAGITAIPFARFFIAASAGSMLWCSGMLSAGWLLGRRWTLAVHFLRVYTLPTIAILVLIGVGYLLIRYGLKRYMRSKYPFSLELNEENEHKQNSSDLLGIE